MNMADAIASLEGIGTFECHAWREKIIRRHPDLAPLICRSYKSLAHRKGYVEANRWLGGLEQQLKLARTGLSLDTAEHQLRDYCVAKAHNTHKEIYALVNNVARWRSALGAGGSR
jgi:hypothetical protein